MSEVVSMNTEVPTGHLRFVNRDGRYILQMQWQITRHPLKDNLQAQPPVLEWTDVPVSTEEIK